MSHIVGVFVTLHNLGFILRTENKVLTAVSVNDSRCSAVFWDIRKCSGFNEGSWTVILRMMFKRPTLLLRIPESWLKLRPGDLEF